LTLQEIDSNFSKAHRIVTASILPIVEDHAKHSNAVWEGSKVRNRRLVPGNTVNKAADQCWRTVLEAILRGVGQCFIIRI
jgi:hypothetical protein